MTTYPFSAGDRLDADELDNVSEFSRIQLPFGEAIDGTTTPQSVAIGDGLSYSLINRTSDISAEVIRDTAWWSQTFTTSDNVISIHSVSQRFSGGAGDPPMGPITAHIFADSAGKPTGSSLGSKAGSGTVPLAGGSHTFVFDTPISVTASTVFHMVLQSTAANNQAFIRRANSSGQGTNDSADSGSTWVANNGALVSEIFEINTVAGKVHKTDASFVGSARVNNFIGFVNTSVAESAVGVIKHGGVIDGLTALTEGVDYFLSDTTGEISTTAGTVSKKVGLSLSTTEILIKHDNT